MTDHNHEFIMAMAESLNITQTELFNVIVAALRTQHPEFMELLFTPVTTTPAAASASPQSSEQERDGFVYVFTDGSGSFKVGCSGNHANRKRELQCASPRVIEAVILLPCRYSRMKELESRLHSRFQDKHLRGEWFTLDAADLEWISTTALTAFSEVSVA